MIICVCKSVSDRVIQQAITQGHQTVSSLAKLCGAGTECGACCCSLRDMIACAKQNPEKNTPSLAQTTYNAPTY